MAELPLSGDPETAYRLLVGDDGFALAGEFMSLWSMLSGERRTFEHIPEGWHRDGCMLTAPGDLARIELTEDEAIAEAFRLSAMHTPVGRNGWHLHSNVVRPGKLLTRYHVLRSLKGDQTTFGSFIRQSPLVEGLLDARDVLFVRPRAQALKVVDGRAEQVVATVLCHPETEPRPLGEYPTFAQARQALLSRPTALVSNRTTVVMAKGSERLEAVFDAATMSWRTTDGTRLMAVHPGEEPRHSYRNGAYVGAHVGYVTVDRRGRTHANVGRPIDSPGDEDASVALVERVEALDARDAIAKLVARGDLDRIFTRPITVTSMGVWLACLGDEETTS